MLCACWPNPNELGWSRCVAQGYYGGRNPCTGQYGAAGDQFANAADAIAEYASVTTMLGVPNVQSDDTSGIAAAVAAAKAADEVVSSAIGHGGAGSGTHPPHCMGKSIVWCPLSSELDVYGLCRCLCWGRMDLSSTRDT